MVGANPAATLGAIGVGFPDLVDALKANVVFEDLDDLTRAAAAGIYLGLSLGLDGNSGGLDVNAPMKETDRTEGNRCENDTSESGSDR